jgi:hypothetical protein
MCKNTLEVSQIFICNFSGIHMKYFWLKSCEKIICARFEVGYLSSMWAVQRKLFFSRYIAGCLIGLDSLVVDFGWFPKF